jgi:membrane-bound lytic murein transglycosylase C
MFQPLMQVVPESGGREAYAFVHSREGIPTRRYLQDPDNNIELGCAYIHLLQKRYFGAVVDSTSRLYCAIAGYNGGPGMVAIAFTGARRIDPAARVINALANSDVVYGRMLNNLPCSETREYLHAVRERMELYH